MDKYSLLDHRPGYLLLHHASIDTYALNCNAMERAHVFFVLTIKFMACFSERYTMHIKKLGYTIIMCMRLKYR